MYELLIYMERESWKCIALSSKKVFAQAKISDYFQGRPKVWYLNAATVQNLKALRQLRYYVRCLLTVESVPVKHCQAVNYYKRLLGPAWMPVLRPRRQPTVTVTIVPADDEVWHDPEVIEVIPAGLEDSNLHKIRKSICLLLF